MTTNEGAADVIVRLDGAEKRYGDTYAVRRADLEIRRGELFTLLGPSGSGKTTILRMIAGLITPSSGSVLINGRDVGRSKPHQRNVGVVFQSLALFPHLNVFDNVAFPLKMRRVDKPEVARRVTEALDVVKLPHLQDRGVEELSGGQRQRVAIARALVYRPDLLLLDEPFAALDRRLREELQLEIVRLHNELGITIVNVTHDQREALMLSDRIGVMRDGAFEQIGTSDDLYRRPNTRFVAGFLGEANVLSGTWSAAEGGRARLPGGVDVTAPAPVRGAAADGSPVSLVLRAEVVDLVRAGAPVPAGQNALNATVTLTAFEGVMQYYEVAPQHDSLPTLKVVTQVRQQSQPFRVGDQVQLLWSSSDTTVLVEDA
ncbi:MAG: ABC transporter ATP-binding protein [Protaetiibacter sp.]